MGSTVLSASGNFEVEIRPWMKPISTDSAKQGEMTLYNLDSFLPNAFDPLPSPAPALPGLLLGLVGQISCHC
jgi:hypothetical protein